MKYVRMGRTGLKVSELCLGTMTFGRNTDREEAAAMLDSALDQGVNFLDTANTYADSRSESMLGDVLGAKRQDWVVATKFFNPTGAGPNDSGMSRVHVMQAVEDSLRRLQTDWIDLYYIHHVDVETPLEEMLRAVDDLVHQGKVRYIGCSNYEAWRLCDALWTSEHLGLHRIECYQPQYSLVVRDIEQEIVPLCLAKQVGMVVWSPLAGGFLAGKYAPGQRVVAGTRSDTGWAFPDTYFCPQADTVLQSLLDAAAQLQRAPSQVALRWALSQPGITSCIVGCRTLAQWQEAAGTVTTELPVEILAHLNDVSHLPHRYPASMEADMVQRRQSALRHVA